MQPLVENGRLRLKRPFCPEEFFRVVLAALQPFRIDLLVLDVPGTLNADMIRRLFVESVDAVPRKKAANTHDKGFNVHALSEIIL